MSRPPQQEITPEEFAELKKAAHRVYDALAALPATDTRLAPARFIVVLMHDIWVTRLVVHVEGLPNRFLFGSKRKNIVWASERDYTGRAHELWQDLKLHVDRHISALPDTLRQRLTAHVWFVSQHNTEFVVIPNWRPGVLVIGPPGIR